MKIITFNIAMISYLIASLEYFVYLIYRRLVLSSLAAGTVAVGLLSHTIFIGLRSQETGHGPYTSSFEVAVFLSWLVVIVFFITHWKYKIKDLGSFVIPVAFLILLYATFLSREIVDFPESEFRVLQTLHRTLSIFGFAAFAIAFGVGVMYLIQEKQVKSKKLSMMYFRMPSLEALDNLNYKVVAAGFPLFTLGFLTVTIWNFQMNQWNLVKTWPMVLGWVVYGLVFFGRHMVGLRGKKAAQGSILGFVTVMISILFHF
ncbi:MAG: cytochrome C assembly protein [Nitrospinaceae bacterium]|nr:cytochrome C assembly protein [Nitrospinaceae bacterium]NIR55007.1 cytochrome C assembly protein [Nitrospinaceae bacterium]NIT82247.1 cytochrome C assembly protein [Nitrospinaceae bacterium]NIX34632.1 cytochrome C assembly protein [Nitrospinaceae bacterium]NIY15464.1 cytochrome C assembly protein [Nitrospinaceae bacterium]